MMLRTPQLALNRLVVVCRGKTVYAEQFHQGVNIIRGTNSSGKSTIADFIFYVLGGEVAKFKPEAESCDEVIAEVEVNAKPLTLRRIVRAGGKQPVLVYYGDFSSAMASPVEGWQVYSMVRSAAKESFSQIMFRSLDFPEVKTDMENSITMHQILRLIYVDQLSPVDAMFRFESFDPPLIRPTVGDIVYGLYDDFLYAELREQREKGKALESVADKLEALYKAVKETDLEIDEETLKARLAVIDDELAQIENQIIAVSGAEMEKVAMPDIKRQIDVLAAEFSRQKVALGAVIEENQSLELEIADSEAFIGELKNRLGALEDSLATRRSLGELPLTHCPHCLSVLQEREDKALCALCGNPIPENPSDSRALRMKQEIAQQLKESQRLLEGKMQALTVVQLRIPELISQVNSAQHQYEEAVERVRPARDDSIDRLFVKKGELNSEIDNINKQAKLAALLKSYESQKAALNSTIQALGISIERRKRTQTERRATGEADVEKKILFLLKGDLPRQAEFQHATKVTVDFGKNTFAVDGRNQFSASSIVYLKNSVHYGIFFSSLDLDFFRYPRFILCDNMEDKGMEQERSRNFQKIIVNLSGASSVRHQIIFTTSMIDPSLNNESYCVGPEYNEHRKSLDFSSAADSAARD